MPPEELSRKFLESLVLQAFRMDSISESQAAEALGLSGVQWEDFLSARRVLEGAYDVADLERDREMLRGAELWKEMRDTFRTWPAGVVPVPAPITGTAFFPGGLGYYVGEPGECDVMVVGQDFNTKAKYCIARREGSEMKSSQSMKNLVKVFEKLELSLGRCFFTNFYMGLRADGPETGPFPGGRDAAFTRRCAEFFRRQMASVKPRIIVTLGLAPLQRVGKDVFGLEIPNTLSACSTVYKGLSAPDGKVTLVGITHPSLYDANVGKRRFLGKTGKDAEIAMIRESLGGAR